MKVMRERLIELLKDNCSCVNEDCEKCGCSNKCFVHREADYLLENGVIVPPFKLGQKVWYTSRPRRKQNIFSVKVIYITHTDVGFIVSVENKEGHRFEMDAEDLYSSREEAEQSLKGGEE